MNGLKTDIERNITPIIFSDDVTLEKLKVQSSHPTNRKAIYINTDTGQLYSADIVGESTDVSTETAAPYNQSMTALVTTSDGDLATSTYLLMDPQGRVDVFINGLSVDLGLTKDAYFSSDNGVTAKTLGEETIGDKLYWNGSIANYELDATDVIDFDYLTTNLGVISPTLIINIVGGTWGTLVEGDNFLTATIYEEPPLESWSYTDDVNNYVKLFVSESATDLIEVAQLCVAGVIETYTIFYPIGGITENDKKIVDQLFKIYSVSGLTITLSRYANWANFSLI